jgi:transposase
MGAKRRRFDLVFWAGAMRIVREIGKPVAQVAWDLGINEYTLHNWVRLHREQSGEGGGGALSDAVREELAQLRRLRPRWPASTPARRPSGRGRRPSMGCDVLKRSVVLWVKDLMNQ